MTDRTITLTGRPPVAIAEGDWPLVANARDCQRDTEQYCDANSVSRWFIGVRQHRDGRTLVYATYKFTCNFGDDVNIRRGVLLNAGSDPIKAVETVCAQMRSAAHYGNDASRWDELEHECIADFPAVAI